MVSRVAKPRRSRKSSRSGCATIPAPRSIIAPLDCSDLDVASDAAQPRAALRPPIDPPMTETRRGSGAPIIVPSGHISRSAAPSTSAPSSAARMATAIRCVSCAPVNTGTPRTRTARDTRDTEATGFGFGADLGGAAATVQVESGHLAIDSRLRAQVHKYRPIADVAPVLEVGGEQHIDDGVLHAVLSGEPHQTMRIEGVRRPGDAVAGKVNALARTHCSDLGVEALRGLPAAELGGAVGSAVHPFGRHARVQLEGVPAYPQLRTRTEKRQRLRQPSLPT